MKWTTEQQNAIDARGGRILVSAAAGSGKTAVLVERVLRLITDKDNPCDIDKLLIVTFTETAASEMREKIVKALSERIKNGETSLSRQLTLIAHAHISTIHAFCTSVLRTYFYALDIEPDFRIADSAESAMLKTEALNETVDYFYENYLSDEAFLDILNIFTTSKNDNELCKTISSLYEFVASNPFPQKWLDSRKAFYDVSADTDFSDTIWGKYLIQAAKKSCADLLSIAAANQSELDSINDEVIHQKYDHAFTDDFSFAYNAHQCLENNDYIGFTVRLASHSYEDIGKQRNYDKETAAILNAGRNFLKKTVDDMRKIHLPINNSSVFEDIQTSKKITNILFAMISDYSERYTEKKKKRKLLDFADLEHFALDLLIGNYDVDSGEYVRTPIAETVANSFSHIIVDEYQDSNLTQDLLFRAISKNERNIFMVGDVKQSIYSFRHAMPELFISYKDNFPTYNGSNKQGDAKITLGKNFRSRTQVVDSVNAVFKNTMSRELGDIDYTDEEKLYFGAESYPPYEHCRTEIDYIDLSAKSDVNDDDKKLEKEARFIAARIGKLFSDGYQVYDRDEDLMRPLRYSDIAILVRTAKDKVPIYEQILTEYGIPVSADAADSYFQTPEVSIIMSLLRAMNNPFDDISLAAVMCSPIFLFTTDELAQIRIGRAKIPLIESIRGKAEDSDDLAKKCAMLLEKLDSYRLMAVNMPVNLLLQRLYEETGFMSVAASMDNGELRCANLRLLEDYARRYEKTSFKGLYNFVLFIDKVESQKSDDTPTAKNVASNSVSIVTIHKSKGLEYPICFIANATALFNLRDTSKKFLRDNHLGVAFKLRDKTFGAIYKTPMVTALAEKLTKDSLSEEMRIFYVGLTRAKEKLIIPITLNKYDGYTDKIRTYVNSGIKPPCDCMASLLTYASLRSDAGLWDKFVYSDDENIKGAIPLTSFIQKNALSPAIAEEQISMESGSNELYRTLSEKLSHTHEVNSQPSRVSVTELKRAASSDSEYAVYDSFEPTFPDFMETPVNASTLRGIAMHTFMEFSDFSACTDAEGIRKEAERLCFAGFLDKTEFELLNYRKLTDFFTSPIAQQLQNAKKIYREKKFSILSDLEAFGITEETVLQGIIDLYFEENDGTFTLVDFKTDRKTEDELIKTYKTQLDAYTKAISEIHGVAAENIKRYIWSFYNSKLIEL